MRANAFWGLAFIILIILGVAVWALAGDPIIKEGTATTTPQQNGNQGGGPLTRDQLEARVLVDTPAANAQVSGAFTVSGKAPGPWYFEASFPIELRNASGTVIAVAVATAQGEWMTTEDVAFNAQFAVPAYKGPATLVLRRDNASGLLQHDASVSIPIILK